MCHKMIYRENFPRLRLRSGLRGHHKHRKQNYSSLSRHHGSPLFFSVRVRDWDGELASSIVLANIGVEPRFMQPETVLHI
jgi:hypothetical protein